MRFLSMKQVRALVLYCRAQIQRLENEGKFPKRVRLGNGPRSRVGWIESEVMDWMKERIALREKSADDSR